MLNGDSGLDEIFFRLKDEFLEQYKDKQPDWGFNGLGYIVYKRTYARRLPEGGTEEFWQTVKRVVEGVFTIQKRHCLKNMVPWSERKANNSAQRMFELMWNFKFTPPGRGLWMMGTDYIYERGAMALNNCGFVSTENITTNFAEPFCFLMDASMVGVGVGGDTKGAGRLTIREPRMSEETYVIEDSREGWVDALRQVLKAFSGEGELPKRFDSSNVRPYGTPIKGFGGTASGPGPLLEMLADVEKLLRKRIGQKITSSDIVDIFNLVGRCVVAGNVRRTAEIMFGDPEDVEFLELKDPEKHKEELYHHRWASNNSVFAKVGMDYKDVAERTATNGEPGYMWLENAREYSRMGREPDHKDYRAGGGNPCLEQTLEPYELCCLVETYPVKHDSMDEWLETLKYAYLYAKAVTLLPTHNPKTNAVMQRNRRIGCSISGITQAYKKFGRRVFFNKIEEGYDKIQEWDKKFSEWLCIPSSIKTTSIKPSGTVSLLSGVTPGVHYPQSKHYIRNIRFMEESPLLKPLEEAGYPIEKDKYSENTYVVSFPIEEEYFDRSVEEVSIWEQLENVAQVQHYWADNQVSVTVNFKPEEKDDIRYALELYETRLKGVSFLPLKDHGYEQAPYITITEDEYKKMSKKIRPEKAMNIQDDTHEQDDKFCNSQVCEVELE